MVRFLLRNATFFSRNLCLSRPNSNPSPSLVGFRVSARHQLCFLSSDSESSKSARASEADSRAEADDVSNEELKRRIEKYVEEGDMDAIPSIFEAILKRKLSRKHDESDDELMEEFRRKQPINTEDMTTPEAEDEDMDEDVHGMSDDSSSDKD